MHEYCPHCGQKTELEMGFYYGTGYVSYAITVGLSILTFLLYWALIAMPFSSTLALLCWIGANFAVLMLLQPKVIRISRILWLSWFI